MKIGLALGSGAARGWTHFGIISALNALDIYPEIICGSSAGALVGASYAAGQIQTFKEEMLSMTKLGMLKYFNITASPSNLVRQDKLEQLLDKVIAPEGSLIEDLPLRFATVATDLQTGREIWLQNGDLHKALWASMALPGLFPPVWYQNRWLVDGGLVNPVPVSLCRALGADVVIAVNLNEDQHNIDLPQQKMPKPTPESDPESELDNSFLSRVAASLKQRTLSLLDDDEEQRPEVPSTMRTVFTAISIMQSRITRSRMAGDPPDVLLEPRASNIAALEFYRAEDAIALGERCVQAMCPALEYALGRK